jgi:DNA-binding transcriptional LysR family regulator
MTSTQVLCFLEAAETLNFTTAAGRLFLSQQAVSKYIGTMENELGTPLFIRGQGTLRLTPAGEHYYALFSAANERHERLRAGMKESSVSQESDFAIGFSEWVDPSGALGDALASFREKHPKTHFTCTQDTNDAILAGLLDGSLDAAFFSEGQAPRHRDISLAPVAAEQPRLFAPAERVRANPDDVLSCWGEPMLGVAAWNWSMLESKIIGERERAEIGLHPKQVKLLPNLASLLAEMRMSRGCALADANFGVVARVPGLESRAIGMTGSLMCASRCFAESPLIPLLQEHLQKWFNFSVDEKE